jgi:alanine racemase
VKFTSYEISKIVSGQLIGEPDLEISCVVTDSRQVSITAGDAFFAIRGKNHDGHRFIGNLYMKGIRVFIVEALPDNTDEFQDAAFILTDNTIKALQLLASHKRQSFSLPVIGITGSAGKTVVKEWLADILGLTVPVVRSPKSYNSQIGVPLSVLKLDERYKLGIFEAGISFPGEMENLQQVMNPEIGIITNIGDAHRENFPDDTSKAREKLKLFKNAHTIVYCSDQKLIDDLISNDDELKKKKLVDWSYKKPGAKIRVKSKIRSGSLTDAEILFNGGKYGFLIPFSDRASVENALTVIATCLALGTDPSVIRKGLSRLVSVAMRMEKKTGINGCQLIEDFYNSDPGSLSMALDYLKSQKNLKTALILSDFIESGRIEKDLYAEVAMLIKKTGIEKFIGIGPALSRNMDLFEKGARFYYSTADFIRHFNPDEYKNEIILLKGARRFEFEDIGKLMELQVHQTLMEVNLDAIAHNLNEFRRLLAPETGIMVMVKAFAYGAGPAEIASLLEYHRVSYLGVAYADEGVELRNAGVRLPVMVMNPDPSSTELMIRYNLEPEIYSLQALERFSEVASRHGLLQYPVHIKIDSGMHRLGFMPEEIMKVTEIIKTTESIKIASVFSHLASSDDPEFDNFTHHQVDVFLKAVSEIREAVGYPFIRHICNSSAILRFPEYQFEMVRLGIGIYGAGKFPGLSLRPVGRFTSRISQIKKIPAGDPVGYGCADVSDNERIIATIPAGYADGLNRKLGNRNGSLFIRNMRVPIIGNVCMDMCMVDISGIDAEVGDEAEIFGGNITVEEMAEKCQTIPYEILTSIPGRVKRVFSRE